MERNYERNNSSGERLFKKTNITENELCSSKFVNNILKNLQINSPRNPLHKPDVYKDGEN
jgi:hypothetical protein